MRLEIEEFNGEGFAPIVSFGGWRVAIVNMCERLREENLCKIERHLETDEVFILLQGEATLHIGREREKVPMEIGKIYNVKCGAWHAISMGENAKVAVVENQDTGKENTEFLYF